MGKAESLLPRLEVRCKELSVVIETDALSGESSGLPSIFNTLKHAVGRFIGSRRRTQRHILNQVNAVFKPGTLTLFLGQPGSGKSMLMKVLAGQFSMDKNVTMKGEISYNGLEWKEVLPKLPQFASYVPQNDHHFPSLTVQETLDFAHLCCAGHLDQLQHCTEAIIDQFGLNSCRDTQIGNTLNRGVSGGECRRVTSGEMQLGTKSIAFLDEISTGLDSATTFDIIWRQREIARNEQKTIVMSLLQPTPEVFELFDNVLLLNDGDVLYHGPRDQVLPYFQNLGLVCPLDVDIADFLLDIATKQQKQYEMIRIGNLSSRIPRRGREFADRFRQSSLFKDTMRMLEIPPSMEMFRDAVQHLLTTPQYRQSFWTSTSTLVKRQLTITLRNKKFLCVRALMVIGGGFIYGTTFSNVDLTNVQVTLGIVYQTAIFLSVGQVSEMTTFMATREVFYKQRRANFYRTLTFVVVYLAAATPVVVSECLVLSTGCVALSLRSPPSWCFCLV